MSFHLQLLSQLAMVVDLAIEDDDETLTVRVHRLAAAFGEVQNSQSAKAERDSSLGVGPRCIVVRTAVAQGFSHSRNHLRKLQVVLLARGIDEASKTAHSVF